MCSVYSVSEYIMMHFSHQRKGSTPNCYFLNVFSSHPWNSCEFFESHVLTYYVFSLFFLFFLLWCNIKAVFTPKSLFKSFSLKLFVWPKTKVQVHSVHNNPNPVRPMEVYTPWCSLYVLTRLKKCSVTRLETELRSALKLQIYISTFSQQTLEVEGRDKQEVTAGVHVSEDVLHLRAWRLLHKVIQR